VAKRRVADDAKPDGYVCPGCGRSYRLPELAAGCVWCRYIEMRANGLWDELPPRDPSV
jgi:hypothetical protein